MDSDLLPARMVNEYVYCPRLFYLEWVRARFADNDDTRLGRQVHRRVDTETGAAPLPADGELRAARSVTLNSDRLGVIATLDLVEGADGAVVPVDYKKGAPQADGTPWPSDEVQVCLQALLLREHGYRCDRAELCTTPRPGTGSPWSSPRNGSAGRRTTWPTPAPPRTAPPHHFR